MTVFAFLKYARNIASLGAGAWLAGTCPPANALSFLSDDLQVHGFFAQGMIKTTANNFLGNSRDVSFDFREIALNANYRALSDLQFSAQLMSHLAGESDNGDVDADYAFMDWTAASGDWGQGGLRLGRVKNPYGLYSASRFIPFARPSIILPQSIYFERTRKIAISSDGAQAYLDWASDWGTLSANVTLGWPDASDRAMEVASLGRNYPGHTEAQFTQFYQLSFEDPEKVWRIAATKVEVDVKYHPANQDVLNSALFGFDPYIFSAQYNGENWSLTAEYAMRPSHLRQQFVTNTLDLKAIGESYYIQGTYNVLPQLELIARYDVAYSDRSDGEGRRFAQATGRPAFTRFSKDWTFGARYDFNQNVMIRAEYHNIDGTAALPVLDNPDPSQLERGWDMWMMLVSFRF